MNLRPWDKKNQGHDTFQMTKDPLFLQKPWQARGDYEKAL